MWGPTGAPGRTTVAVVLATEAARLGCATLLADADCYGGVIAQVLGLLDESPGLAAAVRQANAGNLDLHSLATLARVVGPNLRVLTGIARAERWPELRPSGLVAAYAVARQLSALTVVDCGFGLEQDEELSYDTTAPRRNGSTLATLADADHVIAVGSADPVGLQRLVRGLAELSEALPQCRPQVVVNRVRKGPINGDPEREIAEALTRYAGIDDVIFVPYDRASLDKALAGGHTLGEIAPDSPVLRALVAAGPAIRRCRLCSFYPSAPCAWGRPPLSLSRRGVYEPARCRAQPWQHVGRANLPAGDAARSDGGRRRLRAAACADRGCAGRGTGVRGHAGIARVVPRGRHRRARVRGDDPSSPRIAAVAGPELAVTDGWSLLPTSQTMPSSSTPAMTRRRFGSRKRCTSTRSSPPTSTIQARRTTSAPRSRMLEAGRLDDDDVQFAVDGLDDHELQWYAVQEIAFLLR